jgi:hypothetical protein
MIEAARASEKLVNFYQTTRRYNTEDSHLRRIFCSARGASAAVTIYKDSDKFIKHLVTTNRILK